MYSLYQVHKTKQIQMLNFRQKKKALTAKIRNTVMFLFVTGDQHNMHSSIFGRSQRHNEQHNVTAIHLHNLLHIPNHHASHLMQLRHGTQNARTYCKFSKTILLSHKTMPS